MTTAPDQQPARIAQPPTVITNSGSSAPAGPGGYGWRGRRRQSLWAHFWLVLLTAGIGNVLYALHISRWNKDHGF